MPRTAKNFLKWISNPIGMVGVGLIIAFHQQALALFGWNVQLINPAIGAVFIVVGALRELYVYSK